VEFIAIMEKLDSKSADRMEKVSDEQYQAVVGLSITKEVL
jgi:hypothetical protein